jgi:hypothetical protein
MALPTTNQKLRGKIPSPASPNASEMGQEQSRINGKKKGIVKQIIKPALGGNKFRGTYKPPVKPKYPYTDGEIRRYPAV